MKKGLTEMVLILDKSGSMEPTKKDVVGGLNVFIEEQKKLPGEATFTFAQFDTSFNYICVNKNIKEINPLTLNDYRPNGGTALIETAIKVIDDVGARLAKTDENNKPEKVIVAIMTDGEENASKPLYTKEKLGDLIKQQTDKYNWEFIFLGANFDVFTAGAAYNISAANTFSYLDSFELGTRGFACYNATLTNMRNSSSGTVSADPTIQSTTTNAPVPVGTP